jgi:hypothetical protein
MPPQSRRAITKKPIEDEQVCEEDDIDIVSEEEPETLTKLTLLCSPSNMLLTRCSTQEGQIRY